jgi:hypothetical protein
VLLEEVVMVFLGRHRQLLRLLYLGLGELAVRVEMDSEVQAVQLVKFQKYTVLFGLIAI